MLIARFSNIDKINADVKSRRNEPEVVTVISKKKAEIENTLNAYGINFNEMQQAAKRMLAKVNEYDEVLSEYFMNGYIGLNQSESLSVFYTKIFLKKMIECDIEGMEFFVSHFESECRSIDYACDNFAFIKDACKYPQYNKFNSALIDLAMEMQKFGSVMEKYR